jgi:cell division protein FtsN
MSHDYKHAADPRGPAPIPLWVWIFTIVMVTAFGGLLYYLDQYQKGNIGTDHEANLKKLFLHDNTAVKVTKHKTPAKPVKKKDDKTNFDFYSLLPSMEMVIPDKEVKVRDEDVPKQAPVVTNTNKKTNKKQTQYILQVGSFHDEHQADRLKAGLALLGVESTIEPVKIKNSGTWHRVRVGPFTNLREIDKVRSRLRANNLNPILLTQKP